jgi:hypothetical protein
MSMQAELASLEPNRQYCLTTGRHYSQDHPDELSGICRLIIAYDYSAQHVFSTTKISPIASFLGTTGDFPIPSNRPPKLNFLQPRCISESITFWAGTLELSLRASRSLDALLDTGTQLGDESQLRYIFLCLKLQVMRPASNDSQCQRQPALVLTGLGTASPIRPLHPLRRLDEPRTVGSQRSCIHRTVADASKWLRSKWSSISPN